MDQDQVIINNPDKAPTILQRHRTDGSGCAIHQGRNVVVLDGDELRRLIAAVDKPPTVTSPSHARMLVYPADE